MLLSQFRTQTFGEGVRSPQGVGTLPHGGLIARSLMPPRPLSGSGVDIPAHFSHKLIGADRLLKPTVDSACTDRNIA